LLIQVAERLRACVRSEDTPARLGGDEFAVLADGLGRKAAADLAGRLLASLQRPFELAGQQVAVGASIGIAFAAPGEISPEDLLRNADVAMYVAKNSGKNRFEVFESGMYRQVKEQLDLELDLARFEDLLGALGCGDWRENPAEAVHPAAQAGSGR